MSDPIIRKRTIEIDVYFCPDCDCELQHSQMEAGNALSHDATCPQCGYNHSFPTIMYE